MFKPDFRVSRLRPSFINKLLSLREGKKEPLPLYFFFNLSPPNRAYTCLHNFTLNQVQPEEVPYG